MLPVKGPFNAISWQNENELILQDLSDHSQRLWRWNIDSNSLEQLPIEVTRPGCSRVGYRQPIRITAENIGFLLTCKSIPFKIYAMQYNVETNAVSYLNNSELAGAFGPTGSWVWSNTLQMGLSSDGAGRGLGEQVYLIDTEGWQYIDLDIAHSLGITATGDFSRYFFFGRYDGGGNILARATASFTLYEFNPQTDELKPLISNVADPRGTALSPDEKWLAFYGQVRRGLFPVNGIWVFHIDSRKSYLIHVAEFAQAPSWAPDGMSVAAILPNDYSVEDDSEIVLIDVAELVTK